MELAPPEELTLFVESQHLLRKPGTALQARRFADQQESFRNEARKQVAALGGEPFQGDISVELSLHPPEVSGRQQPLLPSVVKAYLDALEGIAYSDDRQISHLVVHRFGSDHPFLITLEQGSEPRSPRAAAVFCRILPLERYTLAYDHAQRRRLLTRGDSPWSNTWRIRDEVRLASVIERRKRWSGAEETASALDEDIWRLQEKRFTDGASPTLIVRAHSLPTCSGCTS